MALARRRLFRFGPFRLDADQRTLVRGSERVPLRPLVFDTLLVLLEHCGEIVSKEELLDAVWPDTVVEENNLNQNILALRRVLEEGGDGRVRIETVPKRGYRFIADVEEELAQPRPLPIPIPVAPVRLEREPALPPAGRPRRLPLRAVAVLCGVGVFGAGIWKLTRVPQPISEIRSVAVLPLKSLDADAADEPLGLGIAEAIVSRLAQSRDLLVRPMSSSRQAALMASDATVAGARLGVDGVLEGTLQRSDGRLRARVELVRVRDGRVLWSDSFEEPAAEAFHLEDSVSERLVGALGPKIGLSEGSRRSRPVPKNRRAYEAYLRGRYFWNRRDGEDLQKAAAEFDEAIREDPSYALAYAGLADAQVLLGPGGPPDAFPKARAAAERALALDPELAEAHASLGFVRFFADWDFPGSERELRRALELNPGYLTAHQWYAYWLVAAGHPDRAVAEIRRALDIDPTSLVVNRDVGHILMYSRRYEEAIEQFRKTLAMDPGFHQTRLYLIDALAHAGRFGEAAAELQRSTQPHDGIWFRIQEASIEARAGNPQKLRALLPELSPATPNFSPEGAACMNGILAQYDRAFEWLERAYRSRDFYLVFLKADPSFDCLRSDPRFTDMVRRVGIPS